uniref:Uncharacterized protein n=1 Tax=Micrurus spixii TaxID=129469 RepID=A0A2D4MCC7_9SAUR
MSRLRRWSLLLSTTHNLYILSPRRTKAKDSVGIEGEEETEGRREERLGCQDEEITPPMTDFAVPFLLWTSFCHGSLSFPAGKKKKRLTAENTTVAPVTF